MSSSNQKTLTDSRANERPPVLEKRNYIPWESRFKRSLNNNLVEGDRMWHSIKKRPYDRPIVPNPDKPIEQILKPLSKMTDENKKQYIADVRVMNYLLQAIPNDIYNSVDACKNAKDMWERIKRLMFGSDVTNHVRHSQLMDDFDKFTAKEEESLESVYERLTTLVNIMNLQFEPRVQGSKAKKAAKNHDPLALLAHSNASSSQSHANSSYSPQPYYDTHPSLVADYEDEYQRDLQEDSQKNKLTTAMMLLAQAITQKFSIPTNNHLRTSSNTRNQAVIQDGRVGIQTKNAVDDNADSEPPYDAKAGSEVNASNKVHEQVNHAKRKTIIHASDDDQIDFNIIFEDPYVENNGGTSEHDSNAHDEYHDIQMMAYNVQREA
nr:hypothetical protein [Tanacetum cinerariifolium]